jgi:hypothetical protein
MEKKPKALQGGLVVELGAGVGVSGMIASLYCGCREVYLTDVGESVLRVCEENVTRNKAVFMDCQAPVPKGHSLILLSFSSHSSLILLSFSSHSSLILLSFSSHSPLILVTWLLTLFGSVSTGFCVFAT